MIPKIDDMVEHGAFHYWESAEWAPTPLAQECREDATLSGVADLVRQAQALLDKANADLEQHGYLHRFRLHPYRLVKQREWPDASLTIKEALSFLDLWVDRYRSPSPWLPSGQALTFFQFLHPCNIVA